jgi:hypothetical protein
MFAHFRMRELATAFRTGRALKQLTGRADADLLQLLLVGHTDSFDIDDGVR